MLWKVRDVLLCFRVEDIWDLSDVSKDEVMLVVVGILKRILFIGFSTYCFAGSVPISPSSSTTTVAIHANMLHTFWAGF